MSLVYPCFYYKSSKIKINSVTAVRSRNQVTTKSSSKYTTTLTNFITPELEADERKPGKNYVEI